MISLNESPRTDTIHHVRERLVDFHTKGGSLGTDDHADTSVKRLNVLVLALNELIVLARSRVLHESPKEERPPITIHVSPEEDVSNTARWFAIKAYKFGLALAQMTVSSSAERKVTLLVAEVFVRLAVAFDGLAGDGIETFSRSCLLVGASLSMHLGRLTTEKRTKEAHLRQVLTDVGELTKVGRTDSRRDVDKLWTELGSLMEYEARSQLGETTTLPEPRNSWEVYAAIALKYDNTEDLRSLLGNILNGRELTAESVPLMRLLIIASADKGVDLKPLYEKVLAVKVLPAAEAHWFLATSWNRGYEALETEYKPQQARDWMRLSILFADRMQSATQREGVRLSSKLEILFNRMNAAYLTMKWNS